MAGDAGSAPGEIRVEVAFALPARQILRSVRLAAGATVADAVEAAGLAADFPDEPIDALPTGIWGRIVGREQGVKNGDRVEIYRPLELDPRELRRNLAAAGRTMRSSQESDDDQSPGSSV
jgi:putative ubiquitin-RnfH superfamily antitoxin RatB of RatAB toxin-antitoxin module